MLTNDSFFDLTDNQHPQLLPGDDYVWEGLNKLKKYMAEYPFRPLFTKDFRNNVPLAKTLILHNGDIIDSESATLTLGNTTNGEMQVHIDGSHLAGASVLMAGSCFSGDMIAIGKGVLIETGALIKSPVVLGDCNEVRQGAYLRGHILTGRGCVLGHTTEIKHAIFLNDAKAGHFNYIGDSILGNNTNLGAGTKFANLRFIEGNIFIDSQGSQIDTGRRKLGAILGDNSQTGCNSVTNPGTILGKNTFVMPNATVRTGYHEPGAVIRK